MAFLGSPELPAGDLITNKMGRGRGVKVSWQANGGAREPIQEGPASECRKGTREDLDDNCSGVCSIAAQAVRAPVSSHVDEHRAWGQES